MIWKMSVIGNILHGVQDELVDGLLCTDGGTSKVHLWK